MKIVVIGATGTIGRPIVEALSANHEVIEVARKGGDFQADIVDPQSIRALYEKLGTVDAVVSAAGGGAWKPLAELTDEDFQLSLSYKLMGQVNLVRYGIGHVTGSFTLTTGTLARNPTPGSAAISLINSGVEGFARAAALELAGSGVRVNVVSPPWVAETLAAMGQDPSSGQPAVEVAKAYVRAVEDASLTGQVIDSRLVAESKQ